MSFTPGSSWLDVSFRSQLQRTAASLLLPLGLTGLLLGTPATAGGDPLMAAPYLWYDSGYTAKSVAVGDLNHDGHDDLAVADGFTTVGVFLGSGEGTLGPRAEFATFGDATSIAIAEVTGDAHPDLVVTNNWSNVSILAGNGDGTFQGPSDRETPSGSYDVVCADLNRDGRNDIVVSTMDGNFVSVLLNTGGGTFASHQDYPAFCSPLSLQVADLNSDGFLDVVAANDCSPGKISIWLGLGDGTLAPRTDLDVSPYPPAVRLVDVNHDSALDLVVPAGGFVGSPLLAVFPGDGSGGFGPEIDTPIAYGAQGMEVGDFDGDGNVDAAVIHPNIASYPPPSTISVLRGNGDGTFRAAVVHVTAPLPRGIAVGRFDADAKPDLVTAHSNFNVSGIALMHGNGDGTFGSQLHVSANPFPLALATGDLEADRHVDVAVVGNNLLSVLRGDGHASFGPPTDYPTDSFGYSVAIGTLAGDALPDIAVTSLIDNTVSVYTGTGGGLFAPKVDYPTGSSPSSVGIGDVNLDGYPDLLCPNGGSGTVSVLLGRGDGSFGPKTDFAVGDFPQRIALGDIDRDGRPDLVTGNFGANTVSVLLGNGDGTFAPKQDFPAGPGAFGVALGDWNEDGSLDIAASDYGGSSAAVLMGNGDGNFRAPEILTTGSAGRDIAAIDFDGDGHLDLAVANAAAGTVTILRGTGSGGFALREDFGAGDGVVGLSAADFNEDGKPDLAVASLDGFSILLNQSTGGCHDATPPSLTVSLSPTSLWPPNHAMAAIHASVQVHDDCDESPQVSLVSITSNEPDQGTSSEDLPDDIQDEVVGTPDLDFTLRAERAEIGDGRTYRVCYEARDASGSRTVQCATVEVPHDRRGRATLAITAGAWYVTIHGSRTMAAQEVVAGSVMVGTSSFACTGAPGVEPTYQDADGDGLTDARVALDESLPATLLASGDPLYVRWEALGHGYLAEVQPGVVTGVASDAPLVMEAHVLANPVPHEATIGYTLPRPGRVRFRVFDVAGREAGGLVDALQSAGPHTATFGANASSGVYLYRLEWEDRVLTGKFAVLK